MYYEETKNLGVPTKTGYDFTNWTVDGEVLEDNTFTMGTDNVTVTANYTPKTFSVTFNPNGGTTPTGSKTVTYGSTYGDLPTPTYTGYDFLGWFTESTGGTEVTADTSVNLGENQTLFAQWKIKLVPGLNGSVARLSISAKSGNPSFSNVATLDEGVYRTMDSYGTSYYYRGAVTNNYVKFGKWSNTAEDRYYGVSEGTYYEFDTLEDCQSDTFAAGCTKISRAGKDMYWRIIRVNGDGSVRIIYDGTEPHENGEMSIDRIAFNTPFSLTSNDAKYVGYMYGPAGTGNSTTKAEAQSNIENATIKTALESRYESNLLSYDDYLSDGVFCNDRALTSTSAGTGFGSVSTVTKYASAGRVGNNVSSPIPILTCSNNDAFTTFDISKGNGKSKYKVGIITADEVALAGGKFAKENLYYFLTKGASYWTVTSLQATLNATEFIVSDRGVLSSITVRQNTMHVAPIINISPVTVVNLVGEGTTLNPYRLNE